MRIISATVFIFESRMDSICLMTDLPGAAAFEKNLTLLFFAPKNTGADYVRKHFDLEPNIIEERI